MKSIAQSVKNRQACGSNIFRKPNSLIKNKKGNNHGIDTQETQRVNHQFNRIPVFNSSFPVQAKLKINEPNDRYEQEADSIADQVMTMPATSVKREYSSNGGSKGEQIQRKPLVEQISTGITGQAMTRAQRKCAKCEEEEEKGVIQTKSEGMSGSIASANLSQGIQGSKGGGQAMDSNTQSFMESRFGVYFGGVRIHSDNQAAQMNNEINARAFTVGKDVYFNSGQYSPQSAGGKKLLAHELTHVVQQGAGNGQPDDIQRMTIGTGSPPAGWVTNNNARIVPATDTEHINNSISMIREVVTNPERYSSCHQFFKDKCPNGNDNTFRQTFNNAILWKADRQGALAFATVGGTNIAYTQSGYDSGARSLAVTLVHEMLHSCGIGGDESHHLADVAGLYCIGNANEISISAGPAFNADVFSLLFSYRRLLTDIGNGQIQLTAGADLNYTGTILLFSDEQAVAEAGSLMAGVRGRSNLLFGGERFGGLTGRLEAGLGLGRFRVEDADADSSHPEFGAGFVLQTGIGAEFYIPIGVNAHPFSLEATYRLVVPLNQPAEEIHSVLGNIGYHF